MSASAVVPCGAAVHVRLNLTVASARWRCLGGPRAQPGKGMDRIQTGTEKLDRVGYECVRVGIFK